ncbi:unnamed protein product [Caenorhabditis bovis]|uniref:Ubiquilin n=1 Tax=Caenorhabditis bovis TaxID=2654633 RepID=A0A8S1EYD2_9PELO|nr:unnamed protein product [Caenorhabditis bovis]
MSSETPLITISAKTPTQTYSVEIDQNATVSDLKDKLLIQLTNATKNRLCVIYTGKILKDEETLLQHKIGNGHTVHLVVRAEQRAPPAAPPSVAPSAATTTTTPTAPGAGLTFGGMPQPGDIMNNPDMMRRMMDSPIMQSLLSNPELMRTMLTSNPQFQQLIERNPEVAHLLNDPSIMRQTMEMIRNPNMFQEMMRNHDIAIRNLQGIPGGEAALERLYNDVQEPLLSSTTNSLSGNPFASLRDQPATPRSDRQGQENSEALPNPWAPRQPSANTAPAATNNQAESANPFGGMLNSPGISSLMQQMMSDPNVSASLFNPQMMQQMRQSLQSNPQLLDMIVSASPAAQANPELTSVLRERLPDMLDLMTNPQALQAMQNPRVVEAMQQIQQGFTTLRAEAPELIGMFRNMGAGGANAGASAGSATGAQNSSTNPTGMDSQMNALSQLLSGMRTGGAAPQATNNVNPEQQYATQLEQLQGMGFSNRAANIAALTASYGDLNAAVERLLNSPQ